MNISTNNVVWTSEMLRLAITSALYQSEGTNQTRIADAEALIMRAAILRKSMVTVQICTIVLQHQLRHGNLENVLHDPFRLFRECQLKPDASVINLLMNNCVERGEYHTVQKLFEHCFDGVTLTPNIITYSTLMKSYIISGEPIMAYKVLQHAHAEHMSITPQTITLTVRMLVAMNRIDIAIKLWHALISNGAPLTTPL